MNANTIIEDRRLEAMADGDLSEDERRTLLLRLEQEPGGWRRLALAFLETQTLKEAFAEKAAPPTIVPAAALRTVGRWRCPSPIAWLAAAAILAAFCLGLAARPKAEQQAIAPPSSAPAAATPTPSLAQQLAQAAPALSPDERRELERRGFQVRERPRVVHVEIEGQSTPVFVNEVELRYVGKNSVL